MRAPVAAHLVTLAGAGENRPQGVRFPRKEFSGACPFQAGHEAGEPLRLSLLARVAGEPPPSDGFWEACTRTCTEVR